MKESKKGYAESIARLDEILEDIDQSKIPIDILAERVVEAAGLLKRCKSVLTETEAKVKDVLQDLDQEFGNASEGVGDDSGEDSEDDDSDLGDDDEDDDDKEDAGNKGKTRK